MRVMTLLIIYQKPRLLLAMKKRGFGVGRWNGYGGKVRENETVEDAVHRELVEESGGLKVLNPKKQAIFQFNFPHKPEIDCEVHVFKATEFNGEPQETEEMKPKWFDESEIPFNEMWSDDEIWLPLFLDDRILKGEFYFDDKDNIIDYSLKEIKNFD